MAIELFKAALKDQKYSFAFDFRARLARPSAGKIAHFYENDDHIYMKYFRADQVRKSGELVCGGKILFPYVN